MELSNLSPAKGSVKEKESVEETLLVKVELLVKDIKVINQDPSLVLDCI